MEPFTGAAIDLTVAGQSLHPAPAFSAKRLAHRIEAFDGKPLQQVAIVEEDDGGLEEVAHQTPAGGFVCFGPDETRQAVVRGNPPHR